MLWADGLLAWVFYFQRRFDEAEALATTVEGDARRRADSWAGLMMQTLLANLRLWTGRLAEAEQLAERALTGFRESSDRYGVMQALGPLNRARAGLGKKADAKRGVEEGIALGKQFGELGLALQGAAGVAMHLGAGEQALTLAEQVIERNRETGTNQDEAHVLMALAQCQLGRVEEAMVAIERVTVDDFPFGLAARALVRAVAGDLAGALADAEAVEATHGASYFDLALGPPRRRAGGGPGRRRGAQPALARPARPPGVVGRRRRVRGHRPAPRGSPAPVVAGATTWSPRRSRRAGAASSTPSSSASTAAARRRVQLASAVTTPSVPAGAGRCRGARVVEELWKWGRAGSGPHRRVSSRGTSPAR